MMYNQVCHKVCRQYYFTESENSVIEKNMLRTGNAYLIIQSLSTKYMSILICRGNNIFS